MIIIYNILFKRTTKERSPFLRQLLALALSAAVLLSAALPCCPLYAADYRTNPQGPTVVAPGGLSEREQAGLQRQYEFEVRNKEMLLVPTGAMTSTTGGVRMPGEETEGEKIHRYFGVALELYKEGKLEEASEILRYILSVDPQDKLSRSYLDRISRDMSRRNSQWKNGVREDARAMKRQRISTLLKDGVDYYRGGDYDRALVSFYDVLALEPKNSRALSYIKKLKMRYSQQARADDIARSWTETKSIIPSATQQPAVSTQISMAADKLLDSGLARSMGAISDTDLKQKASDKRAEGLLEEVEFGSTVESIIMNNRAMEEQGTMLKLGPGDTLKISILNHPEFSGEVVVQPGGEIVLPLTGDAIMAQGLTVNEVGNSIKTQLDKYIQGPHVFISVLSYKSQLFYVIDEVSCTPYPITRPGLTLRDALFLSDWGNNRALGRVTVMKPSARKPIIKKVDAFDLIFRGNLANNVRIGNGDVIYVPMTVAAKTTKVIYDTLAPFRAVRSVRGEYLDSKWNTEDYKNFFRMPATYDDESQSATYGGGGWGDGGGLYYGGGGYY